ncbi:hypothetical protein CC78DRAFT_622562 [Lojkania enalia]|uniref:F-box domain-containing protein n=1 Tax=Lojkania enalia TaxID=147567 RepID=A0A9P4JXB8_9PLEO|nr:hypothetical protein CC78DRAFT_622562 [Didymosphaeria enalia]
MLCRNSDVIVFLVSYFAPTSDKQICPTLLYPSRITQLFHRAMDQFPQELISQICSHLSAEDLRNTYYVSAKFRKAAEEQAGRYRTHIYKITKENKQCFIDRYSGFRLRYLEHVQFDTYFPDLDVNDGNGCREGSDEQREKDKTFTEQIQNLFTTLKTVEEHAGERNRGKYRLTIYSPSHGCSGDSCLHREHAHWRTHLLEPETLPDLMSVGSLEINNDHSSAKLDYRILIDLVTRFPNLENLECHTGKDEWTPSYRDAPAKLFIWEYDGPRRDTRHGFGNAITPTNIPKSLQRVELNWFCREVMMEADCIHHWKAMPNLVSPASKDPFSTSLRILSYHLQEITLRAQVDETLFWPEDSSTPTWPHLQRVFIMFHMVSPSGAWYFEGPRGEGRGSTGYELDESSYPPLEPTEEDEYLDDEVVCGGRSFEDRYNFWFRISPNDNVLGPFLASFAKAAANMPDLRQAILWSPLRWDVDCGEDDEGESFDYFEPPKKFYPEYLAWGLAYYVPGVGSAFATNPGETKCKARQIWWKVGEWRPNPEIHSLFQQIGRQEHGEALKEYWDDDEFGQGLVSRDYFEYWTPEE